MSTVDSTHAVSAPRGDFRYQRAQASDPKRSTYSSDAPSQLPRAEQKISIQMREKVSRLWVDCDGAAYEVVKEEILIQWNSFDQDSRNFLERAVELLAEFQTRPMKTMRDSLEWSNHLEKVDIDSNRYLDWAQKQYELLTTKKREFLDVSLQKLSVHLSDANWKDADDNSAIVNDYLWNRALNPNPEIYLGPFHDSHLAVRVNGRCLRPPNTDLSTAEFYGVTSINPDILFGIRYVPSGSGSRRELTAISIGNVVRMHHSDDKLTSRDFRSEGWKDTGIALVLSVLSTGGPGLFYMVGAPAFFKPAVEEDEKPVTGLSSDPDSFTLARLASGRARLKRGVIQTYEEDEDFEEPAVKLKVLSNSKLEIVQTGLKGEWSDDNPPVGLYPIEAKP